MATRDSSVIAGATSVLAVLAIVCALYFGRPVLEPIALGLLLATLLRPLVLWLTRRRLPAPVAATVVIVGIVVLLGAGVAAAAGPVQSWIGKVPQALAVSKSRLERIRAPFERASQAVTSAESGAGSASDSSARNASAGASTVRMVVVRVFGTTASLLGTLVEVLLLALFLLAAGGAWRRKLSESTDSSRTERTMLTAVGEMESVVTRYLTVLALINLAQGTIIGLVMWLLGLPNPIVWGVLTFFAEFIPYLGGLSMMAVLALAGLAAFTSPLRVLAPPLAYLLTTTLQNSVVSPITYGRHLKLNPFAILVGVLFWWSLWGVPGAFLAVPFLAAAKIAADHVPSLSPVARFLEE